MNARGDDRLSAGAGPADGRDWPAVALAGILAGAEAHYRVSDAYETGAAPGRRPWYSDQREHVVGWLRELDGPGAYGRTTRGLSARHFWQHFQCAPGLLWVAEALGEDPDLVQAAADAAGGRGRAAAQCAAIRRVIPWERTAELIERRAPTPSAWRHRRRTPG